MIIFSMVLTVLIVTSIVLTIRMKVEHKKEVNRLNTRIKELEEGEPDREETRS